MTDNIPGSQACVWPLLSARFLRAKASRCANRSRCLSPASLDTSSWWCPKGANRMGHPRMITKQTGRPRSKYVLSVFCHTQYYLSQFWNERCQTSQLIWLFFLAGGSKGFNILVLYKAFDNVSGLGLCRHTSFTGTLLSILCPLLAILVGVYPLCSSSHHGPESLVEPDRFIRDLSRQDLTFGWSYNRPFSSLASINWLLLAVEETRGGWWHSHFGDFPSFERSTFLVWNNNRIFIPTTFSFRPFLLKGSTSTGNGLQNNQTFLTAECNIFHAPRHVLELLS